MDFISTILRGVTSGALAVVGAVLILVAAFVVASIVKSLVMKLLNKGKVSAVLEKADAAGPDSAAGTTKDFIGKLVYLLVFLLFVPAIFNVLGLSSVTGPINALLNTVWNYVPNVVGAVIVLVVGFMIAKLVRQLLIPVFDKLSINKLQEKAGIEVSGADKLSFTLAYIVYVLILIPTIVMALEVLHISVISVPAVNMLNKIFTFIPSIFVGLVLIIIGCMIGKFAGQIVTKLIASAGLDAKLSALVETKNKIVLSKFVGTVINAVVVIFFVVEGINVLKLEVLTDIGGVIIGYMPAVLGAIIIFAIAYVASSAAEKALDKNGMKLTAIVAKCAILVVAAFMILSQLGIAEEIVNSAFKLILAAIAVAFAIAFGVGGKDFASRTLKKLEDNMEKKDKK